MHHFDGIIVKIQNGRTIVSGGRITFRGLPVDAATCLQRCNEEVVDDIAGWSEEGNMRRTGFDTMQQNKNQSRHKKVAKVLLPSSLLTDEELSVVDAKADLIATLANVTVTQGCESGQIERTGRWQVRDGKANVR